MTTPDPLGSAVMPEPPDISRTVEVKVNDDWCLFLGKVSLSLARLQHSVEPGRVALLCVGGRITDKHGQPRAFLSGERPAFDPLASRWHGIPGLGHVEQEVVEFALAPGWITFTFRRPLFGFDETDPAIIRIHIDVMVTNPAALWNRNPGLLGKDGFKRAEVTVLKRMGEVINSIKWEAETMLATSAAYIIDNRSEDLQANIRESLAEGLADWGLRPLDRLEPSFRYPRRLAEVLYGIRLGEITWCGLSTAEHQAFFAKHGIDEQEEAFILKVAQEQAGSGAFFSHLWQLTHLKGQAALGMVQTGGPGSASASLLLQEVINDLNSPEAKYTISVIMKALSEGPLLNDTPIPD